MPRQLDPAIYMRDTATGAVERVMRGTTAGLERLNEMHAQFVGLRPRWEQILNPASSDGDG
ncbi:hypothetical protein SK069_14265 [Patulibacter brassicae]|uniref:Uncharacterized protein n=1 Tax=Patulibacter brassicae TaxID=1705717 RepID=A0ABU4VLV3_9ACTN|nr:hypothetical protein [Patulibacter brassicae]MDX8152768.1 hypothetical protein [Patulibacter brassicae]